jgi:DNA mismatch repair protein MutL
VLSSVREKLLGADLTPSAVPVRADNFETADRPDVRATLAAFFQQLPSELAPPVPLQLQAQPGPAPALDFSRIGEGSGRVTTGGATTQAGEERGAATETPSQSATPHTAIQLHNSYLVTETPEGMLIIDQHALHERIMYEELKARITRGPLESQRLLIPHTLPATSRQAALLEQIQPLLGRLGIEVAAFGPQTVAVHAFPTFLAKLDPVEFLTDLLERGEQELLDLHDEELLHEIMDMMACKAAVKAGDSLTPLEIQALIARKDLVDRSSNCPHGRPTTLRLTLKDLEKQFKRTGF